MLNSKHEALVYIATNEEFLLTQMDDYEVKTVYQTDNTKIKVMKDGNSLLQITNHYGNKEITEIFKEMIDCKLF